MTESAALAVAARRARRAGETMFVVLESGEFAVATDYDLDTFYLDARVVFAVDPDGTVSR